MDEKTVRAALIEAATPLFAAQGLHGVSVRALAKAGGTTAAMIPYYFGGKLGLYEAVLREVFSGLLQTAKLAETDLATSEKFNAYVYQCGICFHTGAGADFLPHTASADHDTPECPRCLNNDADSFSKEAMYTEDAAAA